MYSLLRPHPHWEATRDATRINGASAHSVACCLTGCLAHAVRTLLLLLMGFSRHSLLCFSHIARLVWMRPETGFRGIGGLGVDLRVGVEVEAFSQGRHQHAVSIGLKTFSSISTCRTLRGK